MCVYIHIHFLNSVISTMTIKSLYEMLIMDGLISQSEKGNADPRRLYFRYTRDMAFTNTL